VKYISWNSNDKGSILKKIENSFPKTCCEEDKKWEPEQDCSLRPLHSCYFINVGIARSTSDKFTGKVDRGECGNDKIIQYLLPFLEVKQLDFVKSKPDHYSWFLTIQASLYKDSAAFEAAEWKACFIAFCQRY